MFRRLIYAALLVAAFAALQAPAASALGEQCSGSDIQGGGGYLQYPSQARWSHDKPFGFNGSSSPLACDGSQGAGGKPEMSAYGPWGSAAALHNFGADDGVLHVEGREFIGTDIAPSGPVGEEGSELANVKKALGSDAVVVPVTQTAIAIAANPPALPAHAPCTVTGISSEQLEKVFSGVITNWLQLSTASDKEPGGDCDQAITRVVREEGSGTTYQFKHFLGQVNGSGLACTGESKRTWAQLQPAAGESPPNVRWPRKADCQEGEGPVTTVTGSVGEGAPGPLIYVAANPGTITYAPLPEAQNHASKQIIDVYNGVQFASPSTGENEANCAAAKYTLPEGWEAGLSVDWSQVYGSDPAIGEAAESAYPICTLSWDVTASDAIKAFGKAAATTVRDYLAFVISEAGQAAVQPVWYSPLPGPVAEAAAAAVNQIGGEEPEEPEEEESSPYGTVLCNVEPEVVGQVLDCPVGQRFTGEKIIGGVYPGTTTTFEALGSGPKGTISCAAASLVGDFLEFGQADTGLYVLTFGVSEGCATTLPGEPEAVVKLASPPYNESRFVYLGKLAPQGAFVIASREGWGETQELQLEGVAENCLYTASYLAGQVVNGSPTKLLLQGTWGLTEGSAEECPETLQQSSQLTLKATNEGLPLYVAFE
ncbi:MAG TPA: substrate-binding domain-containing protein [Solirubrobacterales bacterium]|nr:substrate-binding domain-containing protein [Solirubrobacterales bacterium]